ncbi:MAG TPA: AraC family transcriptional regulator, partial [Bryobacteraceae bacterium]|nr:AraC family transcriptional regulator [Bryobacteraceae bacterium]
MQRTAHGQPIDDSIQCVPRHVKRALAYMRSNMAEKITLPALASACAAPERTLLKQFQKSVGVSPLAYLRRLRLNLARRELLRADCKREIADIAISCGFTHLGRFATE